MKFKAKLQAVYRVTNKDIDTTLQFTKTQIVFPNKDLSNGVFEDSNIKHGAHYSLIAIEDIDKRMKYQITISNNPPIRLIVDTINEMKLKWIHRLYPIQKEPIGFSALIVSILSLIVAVIKLKCK